MIHFTITTGSKLVCISKLSVDDRTYYHLLGTSDSITESSEAPRCSQSLEFAIASLYGHRKEFNSQGGVALEANTDCAVCTLPYSALRFDADEPNLIGVHHAATKNSAPSIV